MVAVEDADNEVTLSWRAPKKNGDTISGYEYSTDSGETKTWQSFPSVPTESSGTVTAELTSTATTFWVRTVSEGIAPDNVSAASDQAVFYRAGRVDVTAAEDAHEPPSVGDVLTATLTDADVSDLERLSVNWRWERKRPGDKDWSFISSRLNASHTHTHMLGDADVGHQVRAIATHYVDPIGNNLDTATSEAVTVNGPPVITITDVKTTDPSVDENSEDVVYTYTATDPDDNAITWSLAGTNAGLFSITADASGNGVLTFASGAAPDFEALGDDHSYMVDVIASDGSLSSDALAMTVNDVDEPAAFADSSPEKVEMNENIAKVGEYEATDPESHPITWLVLTGTDASAFELASGSNPDQPDQRTLQFKADALPNFEQKTRYSVTLTVQEDSLAVKKQGSNIKAAKRENSDLRIIKKVAAGILTGSVFGAFITTGLRLSWDVPPNDDGLSGVSAVLLGLYYGNLVGFPIGVSSVDTQDSFAKTLMGGLLGGVGGWGLTVITRKPVFLLLGPVGSIYASEKSRQHPQDRRVSFGLSPTPNSGLSVSARLHF